MKEKFDMLCSVMFRMISESGGEVPPFPEFPEGDAGFSRMIGDLKARFPAEWIFAVEKLRSRPGGGEVAGVFDIGRIRQALDSGKRVTVLIRHAERPPLDPSDTSFGEALPVTERGMEDSVMFGRKLGSAVPADRLSVFCSRTFRTIQTACGILKGLGSKEMPAVDEVLGGATPFFGPLEERMELIAEGRYLERLNEYFRSGEQRGYRPLGPAVAEMEERLLGLHRNASGLVVAVTHDINVASFLAGRGVVGEFTAAGWPHYLDAAVVTEDVFGGREYGIMRSCDVLRRECSR